ncbi:hypothetical protein LT493_00335 [Streptomyces tricolor]|nr:hypothetical protein [Streptomyces tricolor]
MFGLLPGSAVAAVADRRLQPVPDDWSFTRAAAVPPPRSSPPGSPSTTSPGSGKGPGAAVVHAAAGGVGMAAVQVARLLGGGISRRPQHGCCRGWVWARRMWRLGTGFADRFPRMDVVLNSLAGEFVDACFGCSVPAGGSWNSGKTDLRDPAGITYRAVDLADASDPTTFRNAHRPPGPARGRRPRPPPGAARRAHGPRPRAFRFMAGPAHPASSYSPPPRTATAPS